jgi:hypothetical protein
LEQAHNLIEDRLRRNYWWLIRSLENR